MPSLVHRASFYLVHHSGFLGPFLDADEHSLGECDLTKNFPRSETMAERATLLPQTGHDPYGQPIFLCVCHSPWFFIRQKALYVIRSTLAIYMTILLILGIVKDSRTHDSKGDHARFFAFDSRSISLACQAIYYWITAVCLPPKQSARTFLEIDSICVRYGPCNTCSHSQDPQDCHHPKSRLEGSILSECRGPSPCLPMPIFMPRDRSHSPSSTQQQ